MKNPEKCNKWTYELQIHCMKEQDKSSDIKQQPPFGNRK